MTTSPALQLLLWGLLLRRAETGSERQTAGELYQRWERYRKECQETLAAAEPPSVAEGFVLRQCGSDGQWGLWRDHTQCENPEKNEAFLDQRLILERLQAMYTVGYSLSLAALLLALLILILFRRLHCTRNYIHINLFASFMLRAAAILSRDRLLPQPGPYPGVQAPALWNQVGILLPFLHMGISLPGGTSKRGENYLVLYPAFPRCWERNEVKAIWWIIRTPILMTILINFLIFIRILGILLSKLRTRQMRCRDYRLRLARSTLTLVPLLGVHEVVFAPVTEEQARGALRFAKLGFEIFLSSFQGFLVSVLYCFINKEVQSEIRRGWHHCRLQRSLGEEQHHLPECVSRALRSGSGPVEVPTGRALSSGTLPGPRNEASRVLESYC
uniref:Gastric inhibitory polypeptide receptor n=1 Tax=Aotus nancymaae TaxID=37293 RepID=A0A2K5EDZ8_AOTNA